VEDVEGTVYQAVQIGTQIWMAENLRVTHYADGTPIPYVTNPTEWSQLTKDKEAYCWYNNNSAYKEPYGALYTWAAAVKGSEGSDANPSGVQGVCPDGWHLPSDEEWKQLESYLGLNSSELNETSYRGTVEGGKLKEEGTAHWADPNVEATNETQFTAMPSGFRSSLDGTFSHLGSGVNYWTSSSSGDTNAWFRYLGNDKGGIGRWDVVGRTHGLSIRCVKD
jgi:uncharacterized protein (TIGR02145 family)